MQRDDDKMKPTTGDRVRYEWQGATVRGRVDAVETEGEVTDSTGEATMTASEDNPVYRVRLLDDDGEPTEQVVLRRGDSLEMDAEAMADDASGDEMPPDEDKGDMEEGDRPNPMKAALDAARQIVAALRGQVRDPTGLKVEGNRWMAIWSNNFEDRERELFSRKAHDAYVARVDAGLTPPPELWVWHLPGTRVGQASWVGRHGHFMLAAGTFDNTPGGRKAAAYYRQHANKTALSHGFAFPADSFDGTTYHHYNTFEITLLPRGAEANRYTTLKGVRDMSLSKEKRQYLEKVFGAEAAAEMLADLEEAGKALADAGVAYKDFATIDEGDETAAVRAVAKTAEASVSALVADLLEGHAEVATGQASVSKEVADHSKRLRALETAVKTLSAQFNERPRRAIDDPTTLQAADSVTAERVREDIKQQSTRTHDFWGTTVSEEDNNA